MSSVNHAGGAPDPGRPLAYVIRRSDDDHRLIIRPGADPDDVIAACVDLPTGAVYRDFHGDRDYVALIFRALPFPTAVDHEARTVRPPVAADGGWIPALPNRPAGGPPMLNGTAGVTGARAAYARTPVAAFWTVHDGTVSSGPWDDRADAARVARDQPGSTVAYGTVAADGTLTSRSAPDDLAVDRAVSARVAGILDDDGVPVRATRDATAGLTVRVARALVLVGVPVADTTGRGAPDGGVILVPARAGTVPGVAFGWATHIRMGSAGADRAGTSPGPFGVDVVEVMTTGIAAALDALGFTVVYGRPGRAPVVTAGPDAGQEVL